MTIIDDTNSEVLTEFTDYFLLFFQFIEVKN